MVARFEVDIAGTQQGFVKNGLEAIGATDRRHGPGIAVIEELRERVFPGKLEAPMELLLELVKRDPAGGWKDSN